MEPPTDQTTPARPGPEATRHAWRPLRWLMLAAFLHGCAYLLLLPPWMGEDEPWHVEYAHYIGRGYFPWDGSEVGLKDLEHSSASQLQVRRKIGFLPREEVAETQATILESMRAEHFWKRVDWAGNGDAALNFDSVAPYLTAAHQPAIYYLCAGQFLRLGDGQVLHEMWLLRALSLFAYLAVVLGSYELARGVFEDPWMALGTAAVVAWWPMHARQAAVVNNDVLVKVFSVWSLVLSLRIARHGLSRGRGLGGLGLAALAVLAKPTGLACLVPLGLACWIRAPRSPQRGTRLAHFGRLALVVLVVCAPLAYLLSDSPTVPDSLADFWNRLARSRQAGFGTELMRTAVGAFNWYSRDLPALVHQLVGLGLVLGALGSSFVLLSKSHGIDRRALFLCLAGAFAQLALVFLRGAAAGRYLMPMIAAFAVLLVAGWIGPWPKPWRGRALALSGLALLLFDSTFLWAGLVWNQYGVWGS